MLKCLKCMKKLLLISHPVDGITEINAECYADYLRVDNAAR